MARAGGQYRADKDGKNTTRVRESTKDHPKGNKARLSEDEQKAEAAKAATVKPANKEVKDASVKV